jgi:hypothetical protein
MIDTLKSKEQLLVYADIQKGIMDNMEEYTVKS